MQVVEPRLEQAAEVVERRLEQAAEESEGAMLNEWQGLSDGALDNHPLSCHSRSAGMTCLNHWIPACAGMTAGKAIGMLPDTSLLA